MTAAGDARSRAASLTRAIGWLALLAGGHLGLTAAGRTLPGPPPPWPPESFLRWIEGHDVAHTSFALLRLIALASVWYLAAITVLVLAARISGLRPLAFLAHRLAVPWARQLVNRALGAGLALTLAGGVVPVAGASVAAAAAVAPVAAALQRADASGRSDDRAVTMTLADESDADPGAGAVTGAVTMRRLPDQGASPPADGARPVGGSLARATVSMHLLDDDEAPAPATSWTIAPGDHLWHVAARTLESRWQRAPSETEITRYWKLVVAHNQDRLAVRGDPDLVYPGQVFELPPLPPPR
jgi:hypothetical protein